MKSVSILVPETAVVEAVADPYYIFGAVNNFLRSSGREPLFDVKFVGLSKDVKLVDGAFTVHVHRQLSDVKKTDLILIPALSGDLPAAVDANKLDGKKCSTHWGFTNEFRSMFPNVELVDGGIITEEQGLYSSGGAASYWNLLLYLVEKYTDRDTAILASKYFAIDIDRDSQSAFTMFTGQKDHEDVEIRGTQEFIEQNYTERITVDDLAKEFAIGRRSLERRFKKATNNSIAEYIQRVKIEAAKRSFESSRKNITEVMFDVGYTDTKAFRTVFKKITGLTPIEYRNKYNKPVVVY